MDRRFITLPEFRKSNEQGPTDTCNWNYTFIVVYRCKLIFARYSDHERERERDRSTSKSKIKNAFLCNGISR